MVLLAVVDALLGTALGLLLSAFARSEFQAVQFLPAISSRNCSCAGCSRRARRWTVLRWVSDALPLTYAVDGMQQASRAGGLSGTALRDLAVVAGCSGLALALGAATLRRRTP